MLKIAPYIREGSFNALGFVVGRYDDGKEDVLSVHATLIRLSGVVRVRGHGPDFA
jgi:hypothetical protein